MKLYLYMLENRVIDCEPSSNLQQLNLTNKSKSKSKMYIKQNVYKANKKKGGPNLNQVTMQQ